MAWRGSSDPAIIPVSTAHDYCPNVSNRAMSDMERPAEGQAALGSRASSGSGRLIGRSGPLGSISFRQCDGAAVGSEAFAAADTAFSRSSSWAF